MSDELLDSAIMLWQKHLQNFTDEEIKEAFDKCVGLFEFPPSVVQFKKTIIGILPAERAYLLRDSDYLAMRAEKRMGSSFDRQRMTMVEEKKLFISIYENIVEDLLRKY